MRPCPPQNPAYLGFVPLGQGIDYPGNDIQYRSHTTLEECLTACITYPGRECLMVTVTTAGECWLKNAIGPNTAANSHVAAFALPCYVQSTCNFSLCDQVVSLPSVHCQCIPAGGMFLHPVQSVTSYWYPKHLHSSLRSFLTLPIVLCTCNSPHGHKA